MRNRLPRPLHVLYEYVALYFGLLVLGMLCFVWTPVALVATLLLPVRWGSVVGRWGITIGFRIYVGTLALTRAYRFDLSALDTLRDEPPLIIAANHPGLLDAVLVISRLPVTCIMKAELEDNFFLGAGARLADYIGNESVRRMVERSIGCLARGSPLLIFPEGTRTLRSPVNPFTGSIGIIARHARVPVQTVFIDTDSPYLSKGWPLFRKPSLPITYRLRLGRRFDAPQSARQLVLELEHYFARELRGSMMQSWLPVPTSAAGTAADEVSGPFPDNNGQPLPHPPHPYTQL